jgi:hypothetical protein
MAKRRNTMRRLLSTVLLFGMAFSSQGCMIAAVGLGAAGTIAYVRGDLQAEEDEPIDVVYEATLKALEDLELYVTSKSKDALVAEITTYDAQDKKIRIKLKASTETTTQLSIRVGVFGSETKSRRIYEKIRGHLRQMSEGD